MTTALLALTLAANTVTIAVAVSGNLLLMIAFVRRPSLRTASHGFSLLSFASCFLIGAVSCPMQALADINVINDNPACFVFVTTVMMFATIFSCSILALTVDRYIFICHPLQAPTIVTRRRVTCCVAGIVATCFTFAIVIPSATPVGNKGPITHVHGCRLHSALPNQAYDTVFPTLALAPIPFMAIIYCRIFFVIRKHIRRVATTPTQAGQSTDRTSGSVAEMTTPFSRARWKKELRSACILLAVVLSYVFCIVPTWVFAVSHPFSSHVSPLTFVIFHTTVYLYPALNPIIYGLGNKTIRDAVKSLFPRSFNLYRSSQVATIPANT
ncbi:trace amine-associated receptor 9-like [Diadema antillarum]|uniref:trace amine-associated receptor 9-like n=1 Tax=Diadema antillarum TaxID=105358 RepID=UPI003A8BCFE2